MKKHWLLIPLSLLADQEGIDLVTPMLGEMIIIDDSLKTSRWWEKVVHADT